MARLRRSETPPVVVEPEWRLQWLLRARLAFPADHVAQAELDRVAGSRAATASRVSAARRVLATHDLLDVWERRIERLAISRQGWADRRSRRKSATHG